MENCLPYVCITHFSHPIPFPFFIFFNFSNPSNYSIPFHFFSTIFFNFSNPYTISLNLNHSHYLKISKVKPFLHHFYKSFSNHSKPFSNSFFPSQKWDGMVLMTPPNKGLLTYQRILGKSENFRHKKNLTFNDQRTSISTHTQKF